MRVLDTPLAAWDASVPHFGAAVPPAMVRSERVVHLGGGRVVLRDRIYVNITTDAAGKDRTSTIRKSQGVPDGVEPIIFRLPLS